jgi:hypothetical protein
MLVAVKLIKCGFGEQSPLQNVANSGKTKGNPAHVNPEPSREPLGSWACVEARSDTPLVGGGMVQSLSKDKTQLINRNYDKYKLTIVPSESNFRRIIGLTRRSLNPFIGHGNPEPSRESFGSRACVEHIDPAPAFAG